MEKDRKWQDCAAIANGLRYNKTLFGFHVAGNEALITWPKGGFLELSNKLVVNHFQLL